MRKILIILCCWATFAFAQEEEKLSSPKKLSLDQKIIFDEEQLPSDNLFKNMFIVQKKFIERNKKFVFDAHLGLNYSDTTKSLTTLHFGVGYHFSENWEVGGTFVPFLFSTDKETSKEIATNTNGYVLSEPKAKSIMGGYINWFFGYGKESFGTKSLYHHDTFLKVFFNKIQYDGSLSGNQMGFGIGKTYYFSKSLSFRGSVSLMRHGYYLNDIAHTTNALIIEPGIVYFY